MLVGSGQVFLGYPYVALGMCGQVHILLPGRERGEDA